MTSFWAFWFGGAGAVPWQEVPTPPQFVMAIPEDNRTMEIADPDSVMEVLR